MSPLQYTIKRLRAFLDEISRLSTTEFPYSHSAEALQALTQLFDEYLSLLENLQIDPNIVEQTCRIVNRDIMIYLPILGFILRSTNVRNAFEVYGPSLRLAGDILEPGIDLKKRSTKLILSSEWEYSPYVYRELPKLPGFALIGLPAPESSNPLLVPLYGHELGHIVWERKKIELEVRPKLREKIFSIIRSRWVDFQKSFPRQPEIMPADIENDMYINEDLTPALNWALRQAEESFSDYLGLCVFGSSFLHAFAYLISPSLSSVRNVKYPNMKTRVNNLKKAANYYKVEITEGYESLFEDSKNPSLTSAYQFLLKVADESLLGVLDDLITSVESIVNSSVFNDPSKKPSKEEQHKIYARLKQVVPAEKCRTLPDILNAAWTAYQDPHFWKDIPQVMEKKDLILKNLVLKNIEVFEIEQILGEPA